MPLLIKLKGKNKFEFAILLSNMVASNEDSNQNLVKCPLCGMEHATKEVCGLNESELQCDQPLVLELPDLEAPEIDLPQFEGPRFDLPETGPLDPDGMQYNLPRFKPPLFDLPKSEEHLT